MSSCFYHARLFTCLLSVDNIYESFRNTGAVFSTPDRWRKLSEGEFSFWFDLILPHFHEFSRWRKTGDCLGGRRVSALAEVGWVPYVVRVFWSQRIIFKPATVEFFSFFCVTSNLLYGFNHEESYLSQQQLSFLALSVLLPTWIIVVNLREFQLRFSKFSVILMQSILFKNFNLIGK